MADNNTEETLEETAVVEEEATDEPADVTEAEATKDDDDVKQDYSTPQDEEPQEEDAMNDVLDANAAEQVLHSTDEAPQQPSTTTTTSLTSNGTSTPTAAVTTTVSGAATAVTADRKQKLLLEARSDRLEWIQKVRLPYKSSQDEGIWSSHPRLSQFQSSRVATEAPTVLQVLTMLYNHDDTEIANQIPNVLDSMNSSKKEVALAIPSGTEILESEILKKKDGHLDEITTGFQSFISKLKTPECAMLVQGMRNFCRHVSLQQDGDASSNDNDDSNAAATKLATTLNNYINATHTTIQSHPAWNTQKKDEEVAADCQRSLESFLYGHVRNAVSNVLFQQEETKMANEEWMERLTNLQFITPKHLELDCFIADQDDSETTMSLVKELLRDPVDTLVSVDCFHSPHEKLQRILHVYHGVNAALTLALNQKIEDDDDKNKVLPSADHVLPALILVVLLAQPKNMVVNLRMVEVFCPPEYLRGEAGYAFTNLYGAIQFLRDVDMEGGPESLAMSPQEFREGLEKCREAAKTKLESIPQKQGSHTKGLEPQALPPDISATEVRTARLRGHVVDLDWATKTWKSKQPQEAGTHSESKDDDNPKKTKEESVPLVQQAAAMSRTYSFLTTRPEEVRVSDLPQLLSEYRTLVHTTEVLLAERTARLTSERKRQLAKERKALEENAAAVDFELA